MSSRSLASHIKPLTWGLYLVGVVLMAYAGWQVRGRAQRLSDWPEINAQVIGRRVVGDAKGYVGEVDFKYQESGLTYTSNTKDEVVSGSPAAALARLYEWPVGSVRTIRYNPQDPSEMDMQAQGSVTRFLWPAILIVVGLAMFVLAIVQTIDVHDDLKAHSVQAEPLPDGGPLPDMDWVARAQVAAEKRRVEAIAAKKVNATVRKQVRRLIVGVLACVVVAATLAAVGWFAARPELVQREEWRRTDATSVGVSVMDAEHAGTTLYSVDALMALERSAQGAALLVPASGWFSERAKAEAESAKVEYGSRHQVLVDPSEPYRGRLADTMSWKDFGWTIAYGVLALLALAGAGWFVREAKLVTEAGERKARAAAPRTKIPTPPVSPTVDL